MPNYVRNVVTIVAKKDDMNSFIHFLSSKGNKELDFNVFIPMPKNLAIKAPISMVELTVGAYLSEGVVLFMDKEEFEDATVRKTMQDFVMRNSGTEPSSDEELVKAYIKARKGWYEYEGGSEEEISTDIRAYKNLKTYGYTDWYTWCVDKWGTKWNAVEATPLDELVPFYDKSNDTYVLTFDFETAWCPPMGIFENIAKRWPGINGTVEYAEENYGYNTGVVTLKNKKVYVDSYEDESYDAYEHSCKVWEDDEAEELLKQDDTGSWYIDYEAM